MSECEYCDDTGTMRTYAGRFQISTPCNMCDIDKEINDSNLSEGEE